VYSTVAAHGGKQGPLRVLRVPACVSMRAIVTTIQAMILLALHVVPYQLHRNTLIAFTS
jgi:hypothetical protein